MIRRFALIATLFLIFSIPWETAITISSLGTFTRLVGFGAGGIWIASVLASGKFRKFSSYHIAVFIFIMINLASLFWTVSYDLTIERIKTYLQLAILTWILWDLITTPHLLRITMQIFIFGAYITIASQLINFFTGQTIAAYSDGRFTGAGQNANEFSLILSLTLPLAWHLGMTQKPGPWSLILKMLNIAYIPLALIACILTASRTSLITVIPGLLYIAGTLQKIKPLYRFLIFAAVIITFVIVEPFIPQSTIDRLATFGSSVEGSDLGGRVALWKQSFDIFKDHPILGIGSNALSASGQLGAYAHNTFLSIMAELGVLGLFPFLVVLTIVFYKAFTQPGQYSALWITVLTIWLIGVFTLTWEYTKSTWFFLSMVVISAGIYHQPEELGQESIVSGKPLVDTNSRFDHVN
jgi:O-antigen ligase